MLGNDAREYLLCNGAEHAALALDLCYRLGQQQNSLVTVQSLMLLADEAGIETSAYLVRRGLAQALKLGLVASVSIQLARRGRPNHFYQMRDSKEVSRALDVQHKTSDPLPDAAYSKVSAYRRCMHLAFLKRMGDASFSRKWLGQRLGVGKRATWAYEQSCDELVVEPSFRYSAPLSRAEVRQLPDNERGALHLFCSRVQRPTFEMEEVILPMVRALAFRYLNAGYQVCQRMQKGNRYIWMAA